MFDFAGKAGEKSQRETVQSTQAAQPSELHSGLQATLNASPKVRQLQAYSALLQPSPASVRSASAIVQRVSWQNVQHDRIEIDESGGSYDASYDGDDAGRLELFQDPQGRQWINFIEVEQDFQRRGIGLSLLSHAVDKHGEIYAAVDMQASEETGEDDTRHLSEQGAALVSSAVRNGILKEEWCFNPAMHDPDQMDTGSSSSQGGEQEIEQGHVIGLQSGFEEEQDSGEEDPDGPLTNFSYDVEIVLDDSNTEGMGYEWWMDVTHVFSGTKYPIQMEGTIDGEEVLTKEFVGAQISRIIQAHCVVRKLEIEER